MGLALVVTADDFGIGVETSRGIIESHLRGPVTATSLMAITGDHVRASIPLLEKAPNLDVGLHVVLTRCGHKPLAATKASGLVDREGNFHTNGGLWIRAFAGRLNKDAVAEEIAAQAEVFKQLMGRSPDYVDSHHHSHQLPTIRQALVEVIGKGVLPAIGRTSVETDGIKKKVQSAKTRRAAARFIGKRAAREFRAAKIWANDYFFGMLDPADFKLDFPWRAYFGALPESGVVEWIVHPGFADETLKGRDDYLAERAVELDRLTSRQCMAVWEPVCGKLARKSVLAAGKKKDLAV
jgi:chitin disaccharide deacetylase